MGSRVKAIGSSARAFLGVEDALAGDEAIEGRMASATIDEAVHRPRLGQDEAIDEALVQPDNRPQHRRHRPLCALRGPEPRSPTAETPSNFHNPLQSRVRLLTIKRTVPVVLSRSIGRA